MIQISCRGSPWHADIRTLSDFFSLVAILVVVVVFLFTCSSFADDSLWEVMISDGGISHGFMVSLFVVREVPDADEIHLIR